MSIKYYIFFFAIMITSMQCQKQKEILFEMKFEHQFLVPAGLNNVETHVFTVNNIASQLKFKMEQNNLTMDDIESINATVASLEGAFNEIDYSTFARVIVELLPTDRSKRYEAFYQENIPFNQKSPLQLFGSLTNLTPIFEESKYNLDLALTFRTPTVQSQEHILKYSIVAYGK